jgi:hypothetical protein
MTRRSWYADIHLKGWSEDLPAEVLVELKGPNGGKKGFGRVTPAEARRAARELIDAADMVDPPVSLRSEHSIYFRGYELLPVEGSDRTPCIWHKADGFLLFPPRMPERDIGVFPRTFQAAREAVIEDINAS